MDLFMDIYMLPFSVFIIMDQQQCRLNAWAVALEPHEHWAPMLILCVRHVF
jgi:hypothetical protein